MGQAAASGDLDQVRLVAVAARELERIECDEREHAWARPPVDRINGVQTNSPTSYAGQTGSVDAAPQPSVPMLPPPMVLFATLLVLGVGTGFLMTRGPARARRQGESAPSPNCCAFSCRIRSTIAGKSSCVTRRLSGRGSGKPPATSASPTSNSTVA